VHQVVGISGHGVASHQSVELAGPDYRDDAQEPAFVLDLDRLACLGDLIE
jgi:hypothetical protein